MCFSLYIYCLGSLKPEQSLTDSVCPSSSDLSKFPVKNPRVFSNPSYLPGNRAGVKQGKWGLSPLQTEGDPNFPSDACHASSWRLSLQSLGASCSLELVNGEQRQASGCEKGAPGSQGQCYHLWCSLCRCFLPQQQHLRSASFLYWFCKRSNHSYEFCCQQQLRGHQAGFSHCCIYSSEQFSAPLIVLDVFYSVPV